jgi:hypothetical protein
MRDSRRFVLIAGTHPMHDGLPDSQNEGRRAPVASRNLWRNRIAPNLGAKLHQL